MSIFIDIDNIAIYRELVESLRLREVGVSCEETVVRPDRRRRRQLAAF